MERRPSSLRDLPESHGSPALLLPAILLIAFDLRPAMSSLSPLLETIRIDLGLSHAAAGLLTTIPVVCMGVFPILADGVAARFGTERALLGALGLVALGTAARLAAEQVGVLYATVLMIGVGFAGAQTFMPAVVKRYLGARGAPVMALVATVMTAGSGVAAGTTALLAVAFGSWAGALASWSILAIAALVLWALAMRNLAPAPVERASGLGLPWRSATACRLSLVVATSALLFWSVLAWLAPVYRERGWSDPETGGLLAANAVAQVTTSLVLAALAGRSRDRRPWLVSGLLAAMVGFLGVALLPAAAPWVWSVIIGAAVGLLFPIGMLLPLDYASDPREVRRLTAMSLSIGYVLAALGPFALGWLRGVTGSYVVPFLTLVLVCVGVLVQIVPLRPRDLVSDAPAGRAQPTPTG